MSNLIKINNIAVGWMEGHFHGEDVQTSECPEKSFAAMKEICELSKYPFPADPNDGWTPCSVALPKKTDRYNVTILDKSDGSRVSSEDTFFADTKQWFSELRFDEEKGWVKRLPDETRYVVVAWASKMEPYRGEA